MQILRKFLLPLWLLLCWTAHGNAENLDALAPTTDASSALAKPLHTITVATSNLEMSRLFYEKGLGLNFEGPIKLDEQQRSELGEYWGIPSDIGFEIYHLHRNKLAGVAQIRLLLLDRPTPTIHQSWNAMELGPFSMGFPNTDQISQDKHMRRLGFGALNQIEIYPVPRTDGSTYQIYETIFNGPEFVHAVGIQRGDGMKQLGPVDATGLGGPAYSAQVIENSDQVLAFYQEVLGMELRSDRHWKSAGSEGALNVPDGTEFRFSIVYSRGASSGHLLFVHYLNQEPLDSGVKPTLPNRGIAQWTFPVSNMAEVIANAETFGAIVINPPKTRTLPILGQVLSATIEAPNGFHVEVFEQ